ncbi:hypothetical protein MLD38_019507 [Melastoma candidum]|uniref:Uncharacterized protein n=1 Tax=Melastoma candidum TaxID=119954 RepID=A0ACB9QXA3_9MYRT|nr:hypothetical protein MLD38_019507 [Melastoma candidum]
MASTGSMPSYFRQKKTVKSSISKKGVSKSSTPNVSTVGSNITQPPALVAHGFLDLQEDHGKDEELLRDFDMNMAYGPCLGMSRAARWDRAQKLGLNPPKEVEVILKSGRVGSDCLWEGCV